MANRRFLRKWLGKEKKKKIVEGNGDIAKRWRSLSGENYWKNLLDPLDLDLRSYIIHYGEMAQATYDTFNSQTLSKYAGSSIYSKNNFFSKVGLEKGNPFRYEVTKFFYATSGIQVPEAFILRSLSRDAWSKQSNFMGFVAVATNAGKEVLGRRDIVVAWRGTVESLEWVNDFQFNMVSADMIFGQDSAVKVHQGWYSIYTSEDASSPYNKRSARDQVLEEVKRQVEKYKNEEISITVTGHSLGGALATLNAADIVASGYNRISNRACPVTAFVFAGPRVGDSNFKKVFIGLQDVRVLRIPNALDVVNKYPFTEVLEIDTQKSPYLKSPGNLVTWHDLEIYLHGVAGTQGSKGGFRLEVNRDIGLVNKERDGLKEEFLVPKGWRVLKNTGMVQQEDGSWKLMDHEEDNDNHP
ncbi:hypothetical protein SLEP1_g44916 [Rubroshorea leprosula]|uniref:Phospholipase A1 n=1 Tax=Rubroshorea leprosula TaxID=152421 RepID=A0AAV5LI69_9ROSI|nr:hypothetical protein SLEP1_g44916 [Rubroshorea leprosula]